MSTITAIRTWLDKDDNRASLWVKEPRCSLAYAVNELGQRVLKLSGKIHPDPISDLGAAMDGEFDAGYRVGHRAGRRQAIDAFLGAGKADDASGTTSEATR